MTNAKEPKTFSDTFRARAVALVIEERRFGSERRAFEKVAAKLWVDVGLLRAWASPAAAEPTEAADESQTAPPDELSTQQLMEENARLRAEIARLRKRLRARERASA